MVDQLQLPPGAQSSTFQSLLDRNFVIGFFLPSIAWVGMTCLIINKLRPGFLMSFLPEEAVSWYLVSFGVFSLIGGAILLIMSGSITRCRQGYWPIKLTENFNCLEKWRCRKLTEKLTEVDLEYKRYQATGIQPPAKFEMKRSRLYWKWAQRFPHDESLILPTSFGNTIRAFEVYPYLMYGIDFDAGWYRLLAIIPEKYQDNINQAKTIVNFWLNLGAVSCFVLITYIGFAIGGICSGYLKCPDLSFWPIINFFWIPVATVVLRFISNYMARVAAVEWGNWVKSAFDVYLPELRTKLGFSPLFIGEKEKDVWRKFSQAAIYRNPKVMPDRVVFKVSD